MSKFLQHIPCPKCKSRDNCGEYTDHYYCFGCKWYKTKDDIKSIRERLIAKNTTVTISEFNLNLVDNIPKKAMQWLLKFGITLQEITDFHIKWEPDQELLVLLYSDKYWQARTFGNQKVKYLSKGVKPLTFYGQGSKLVCVEDILSAIKIARLHPEYCALPLLGCSLPEDWVQPLSGKFNEVIIWLDRNKAKEAIQISKNLRQRSFNSRVVISPLDPKEYSKGELSEWLKKE